MAIQRLNFTKRKKLTLDQVRVELLSSQTTGARRFQLVLNLPPDLPKDAPVVIEAYRNSPWTRMRFALGTVGSPALFPPEGWSLTAFEKDAPPPAFRLNVVDVSSTPMGKIVASADGIRPIETDDGLISKKGILRTAWRDNEGLVWDLDLEDEGGPILYIDRQADPDRALPSRTEFKALVYPEIMRRVLTRAVVDSPASSEDPENWASRWASFPKDSFGFAEPLPESDDPSVREGWIDAAVKWCSRRAGFVAALTPKEADE